jgi:hypothetical protein
MGRTTMKRTTISFKQSFNTYKEVYIKKYKATKDGISYGTLSIIMEAPILLVIHYIPILNQFCDLKK